uniref:Uncharacterized protein n=1 Tax=Pithovirus LCPAC201 TaxID=2506591 RepID=A0A481Z4Q3_9VIRU|nr:MAG: uncharacterized protein LCPAC201_00680 [Pithovirus LCPAC201]
MFTPGRKSSHYTSGRYSGRDTPAMVLKSGGLALAKDEIKNLLDDLYSYKTTQINELNRDISAKFTRLISYVTLLYDTPEYETFYQWVIEKFGDQKEIIPATVGGYLIGCTVSTSFSKTAPGCAICCAGSMPRPKSDHSFKHCEHTVLRGIYNDNGYRFTIHRRALNKSDHENAYLYIKIDNTKNYHGFTEAEKKNLMATGVKRIKLYGFESDGRNYVELTSDLIPVEKLKSRSDLRHSSDRSKSNRNHSGNKHRRDPPSSGSNAAWIIIIVIIILVVIFLIWFAWSARNKQNNMHNSYRQMS